MRPRPVLLERFLVVVVVFMLRWSVIAIQNIGGLLGLLVVHGLEQHQRAAVLHALGIRCLMLQVWRVIRQQRRG